MSLKFFLAGAAALAVAAGLMIPIPHPDRSQPHAQTSSVNR